MVLRGEALRPPLEPQDGGGRSQGLQVLALGGAGVGGVLCALFSVRRGL